MTTKFEPIADDLLASFEADCADSQDRDRRSNLPGQSTVMMKYFGQTIARLRLAEEQAKRMTTFAELARLEVKYIFEIATKFGWDEKTNPEPAASFLHHRLVFAEAKLAAVNMELLKGTLENGMQSCARAVKEGWGRGLSDMRAEMPNATEAEVVIENATAAAVASYSLGFCEALVSIQQKANEIRTPAPKGPPS